MGMKLSLKSLSPVKQIPASLGYKTNENFFGGVLNLGEDNLLRRADQLGNPVGQMSEYDGDPFGGWKAMGEEKQREDEQAANLIGASTAELIRAQWEDYKQRFRPVENALMQETGYANPQRRGMAIAEGKAAVNSAFDLSAGIDQRNLGRKGMKRTADQQMVYDRLQGLDRAAALTDAEQRIGQLSDDRDRQIAAGGIPNAGRSYGLRSEG